MPHFGIDHGGEPQPLRLGDALLSLGHRADFSGETDLTHRRESAEECLVAERTGDCERDSEICAGLREPDAAHRRHVHVVFAELHSGPPLENREQHRDPRGVHAVRHPARVGCGGLDNERLHLDRQRATALDGDGDAGSADRDTALEVGRAAGEKQSARVGDLGDAVSGHLEAAHLIRRSEAVLVRAHEAKGRLSITLELADHVDEVLEQARAGDRTIFGDVTNEKHGQVAILRDPDERRRHLPHLRRPAGQPIRKRA